MNRATFVEQDLGASKETYRSRVELCKLGSQLTSFFGSIHCTSEGFLAITSGFLIGKKLHGITRKRFLWPAELDEAIAWIGHEALIGRDVYHSGVIHQSGRRNILSAVSSLAAEVDHRRLPALPEPTLVVQSSPTLRQCYWRLDHPIRPDEAEKLLARIGADLSQILLIPGTPNNRFSGGPEIQVVSFSDAVYDAVSMAAALPDLSSDPLAKGWHPLPQLRPAERLGQTAIAVATVAGSGTMKVGMAAMTAAIAVTGLASVGRAPEPNPVGIGTPQPRVTASTRIEVPSTVEAHALTFVSAGAQSAPVAQQSSAPEHPTPRINKPKVEDVVAGSPGTSEVESDPGAISNLATGPANDARALAMKVTETQLGLTP